MEQSVFAWVTDDDFADLADYQRLTAKGKLGEAGQKLDDLKLTLDELQKTKQ